MSTDTVVYTVKITAYYLRQLADHPIWHDGKREPHEAAWLMDAAEKLNDYAEVLKSSAVGGKTWQAATPAPHICGLQGYSPGPPHYDPPCPACIPAPSAEVRVCFDEFNMGPNTHYLEIMVDGVSLTSELMPKVKADAIAARRGGRAHNPRCERCQ